MSFENLGVVFHLLCGGGLDTFRDSSTEYAWLFDHPYPSCDALFFCAAQNEITRQM
jgi:hypothetical protein